MDRSDGFQLQYLQIFKIKKTLVLNILYNHS